MDSAELQRLRGILTGAHTIAVVGASMDPTKAAHRIPAYLANEGLTVIPVNPRGGEIFGVPAQTSLTLISTPVDIVDVFRPASETPEIASQAVQIGAKVLWLQLGIKSEEASEIALAGGLQVVMDCCIGATYSRLGLGEPLPMPGPGAH